MAKVEAGATNYYHHDHLCVRMRTDSSGNVLAYQGHYPYGETWHNTGSPHEWMFTSYQRDAESGNDYAMHRYDVTRLGRFSTPDPVQGEEGTQPQGLNRYAYVASDPVNGTDPQGLSLPFPPFGICGVGGPRFDLFDPFFPPFPDPFDPIFGGLGDLPFGSRVCLPLLALAFPRIAIGHTPCNLDRIGANDPFQLVGKKFRTYNGDCTRILGCSGELIAQNVPWDLIVERHKTQYGVPPNSCPLKAVIRARVTKVNLLLFTECFYQVERVTFVSRAD